MNNLVKMTRSEYTTAKANRTLVCPNVALISDEYQKVEYLAQNPPSDIGICAWEDGHRTFYSRAQWEELATKPTALGVYVFTEQTQFIIHGTIVSGAWSNTTTMLVDGVTTANNSANALLDFAGKENTDAALLAVSEGDITDAPIFTAARALTCADSSAVFSVAAAGQVELVRLNAVEINACRTALNQTTIGFGSYMWSSTQCKPTAAWSWAASSWVDYYFAKNFSTTALAIAEL